MRILILILAFLAGVATELLAQECGQNCGTGCRDCEAADGCDLCFPSCGTAYNGGCGQMACDANGCNVNGCNADTCNSGTCNPAVGDPSGYDGGACTQAGCNQASGNGGNCDPYTYYQLREDWRRTHGPILDSMRWLHNTKPKHHPKHDGNGAAQQRAQQTPWHGNYYYPQWGGPVALVVPPTAEFQTNYSWGVPASRISPIDAQFSRNYPGMGGGAVGGTGFMPPPQQPSDTNQFGVYYVRGPW